MILMLFKTIKTKKSITLFVDNIVVEFILVPSIFNILRNTKKVIGKVSNETLKKWYLFFIIASIGPLIFCEWDQKQGVFGMQSSFTKILRLSDNNDLFHFLLAKPGAGQLVVFEFACFHLNNLVANLKLLMFILCGANTQILLCTTALSLVYSIAEYCAPICGELI